MAPSVLPPVLVTAAAMAQVLLDEGVKHGAVREVLSFPLWSRLIRLIRPLNN